MSQTISKLVLLAFISASLSLVGCVSVKNDKPTPTTSRTTTLSPAGVSQTTTVAQ